ncbi:MAG TPA: pyridoxal phosphate-dependent aminotransferase [Vicinamibacteria bacterium]|nr:pyridoxal phosphate-dependent aminotransferase [Vicinamibacteria bacterium]
MRLARRVGLIQPSPTMAVMAEAMRLRAAGEDIVDFSAGQPDFATPEHIKDEGIQAIAGNFTRYTANSGTPELRKAIADRYRQDYGLEFEPSGVLVTSGGKHALLNLILAIVDEGDEVIIPTPYWSTFPEQVRLAGGEPAFAMTSEADGFRTTAKAIRPALSDKTRVLLLNFPSNPTGAVIDRKELEALGDLVEGRDIFFIWDDTYARLMFEPAPGGAFATLQRRLGERFVVAGTASKAYAMTGWRLGWALGPPDLIAGCDALQSHMTSHPSSISQRAALAALRSDQARLAEMVSEYRWRSERLREGLLSIEGLTCAEPGGGFYLFPNVSRFVPRSQTATDLAGALLNEERVAVVPGLAFGCDGHWRVSFATSRERIEEGIRRLQRFFRSR